MARTRSKRNPKRRSSPGDRPRPAGAPPGAAELTLRQSAATEPERTDHGDRLARFLSVRSLPEKFRRVSFETAAAMVLVTAVVLWRTWMVLEGSFFGWDWRNVSLAAQVPFLRFVVTTFNGHLMIGQFALIWLVRMVAPLNFAVAVTPMLLATFASGVLMWKLLNELFGQQPANLIPLAVFMLCPLSIPPALWWADSLLIIPLQLFIVAVLLTALRYARAPSRRRLLAVGVTYGAAVLFWQKGLILLPLVALFGLLFLGQGRGRARLRSIAIDRWPMWAVLGGITVPYLAWYLSLANGEVGVRPTLGQVGQLAGTALGRNIIPASVGGPWSTTFSGHTMLLPEIHGGALLTTWIVVGVIVAASLLRRRQAWRGWGLVLAYAGMCVLLVAVARQAWSYPPVLLGATPDKFADVVPVLALGAALAFMVPLDRRNDLGWIGPVLGARGADRKTRARFERVRGTLRGWVERSKRLSERERARLSSDWAVRALTLTVVLGYAASALFTSTRMADVAARNSTKPWLASVESELAARPGAAVLDGLLPRWVAGLSVVRLSAALTPVASHIRWDGPGDNPLMFDELGRLRPVRVVGGIRALPGPRERCGYYFTNDVPGVVYMDGYLPSGTWAIRIGYFGPKPAHGFVTVRLDRQSVRFLPGLHQLVVIHRGPVPSVTIRTSERMCVFDIHAGVPVPIKQASG